MILKQFNPATKRCPETWPEFRFVWVDFASRRLSLFSSKVIKHTQSKKDEISKSLLKEKTEALKN
jgi:hypothetical protein